MELFFMRSW